MHTPLDYAAVFGARNKVLRGPCFDLLRGNVRASCVDDGSNGVRSGVSVSTTAAGSQRIESIGSRLGLIVPKRLARRAVLRNTIKRQVRESFRHVERDVLPPVDLVFRLTRWPQEMAVHVATPAVLKPMLRQEIDQLLVRLIASSQVAVANSPNRG